MGEIQCLENRINIIHKPEVEGYLNDVIPGKDQIINPQIDHEDFMNSNSFCKLKESKSIHNRVSSIPECHSSINFEVINMWYGVIDEIDSNCCYCNIEDSETEKEELIELEFSDFNKDDKELIYEGATFQYFIGYHNLKSGQKLRSSMLVMDRYVDRKSQFKIDPKNFIKKLKEYKQEHYDRASI